MKDREQNSNLASNRQEKPQLVDFVDAFAPLYEAGFRIEYLSILPERNGVDPAAITILSRRYKTTKRKKYYTSVVFKRLGTWIFVEPVAYQGKINEPQ